MDEAKMHKAVQFFTRLVEGEDGTVVQFIREVIEEESGHHYEPYDLSDPEVRDSLRGRWFCDVQEDEDTPERMVTSFECNEDGDEWCVNGIYTANTFLRDCVWIDDGAPCGRKVE